jgi:hypothetical protein
MPARIAPQLVRPTPTLPAGAVWVHEVKHDGHRVVAYLERGRVRLKTRAGNDATGRFAPITELLAKLPVRSAVLDGEIAVPDARGVTKLDLLGAASVTVRNIITSMRLISDVDWTEMLERVSLVDDVLAAGSGFSDTDFPTRNLYRTAVEDLAREARQRCGRALWEYWSEKASYFSAR